MAPLLPWGCGCPTAPVPPHSPCATPQHMGWRQGPSMAGGARLTQTVPRCPPPVLTCTQARPAP